MNPSIPRPMNAKTVTAGSLAMAMMAGPLSAASVVVDWLQFVPGTGGAFTLRSDGGTTAASGLVVATSGAIFPGTPAARNLTEEFWGMSTPQTEDSVTENGAVSGFQTRVVATSGQPVYQVELTVPENRMLYIMAGDLMWTAGASTSGLEIKAISDTGNSTVTLLETLAGNDGSKSYTGGLTWNGTTLSTQPGTEGDSRFAILQVGPMTGGNSKIIFSVPTGSASGFAAGSGDTLFFAIGLGAIPEPGVTLMGAFGALALFGRRSRRQTS